MQDATTLAADYSTRWLAGFSARARVSSRVMMSGHLDDGRLEAD